MTEFLTKGGQWLLPLVELQARRFDQLDILVVWVDGMQFGDHHVLAAVGADRTGVKHVPGVAAGSSENYHVARDLLCGIIERGLDPGRLPAEKRADVKKVMRAACRLERDRHRQAADAGRLA